MHYLLLAIASSALVSIIMRLSESRVQNKMGFFLANYLVCTALALYFTLRNGLHYTHFSLGFGGLSGFLFLYSFMLLRQNVSRNGVVLSATFMKLGVLIPTLMAVFLFREQPRLTQILGIALALTAILLLHFEKDAAQKASGKWLLILLLVISGFTDSTANIFDKLGNPASRDFFLVCTFFTAFLCSGALALAGKGKITCQDLLFGSAIGVPNYFSSLFLLGALESIPAVVVYPVFSVSTIVVITIVGAVCFHESLNRRKLAALLLIFAALALLNA